MARTLEQHIQQIFGNTVWQLAQARFEVEQLTEVNQRQAEEIVALKAKYEPVPPSAVTKKRSSRKN